MSLTREIKTLGPRTTIPITYKWPNPDTKWKAHFYNELHLKLIPLLPDDIHLKGTIPDDHHSDSEPIIEIYFCGVVTIAHMWIENGKLILEKFQENGRIELSLYDPRQFNPQRIADEIKEIDQTSVQTIQDFK